MATEETAPQVEGVPTCYRHAGRETYIRCVRCERPICPDCMVPASVGFQCPECVREANRDVRTPRTVFGGRVSDDPGWISRAIIAVTAVVFVLQQLDGLDVTARLALTAYFPDGGGGLGVVAGEWYRVLSVALVHQGVFHLLLNMYALYLFGPPIEAALGRGRFIALYVLSAAGGSAASYAFNDVGTVAVGASGAIFGLFAAHLVVSRRLGRDASQLWVLLAINVVFGFLISGIDWRAHAGGFLVGGAVAAVLVYAPRARRNAVQAAGLALVAVLVVGAIGVRTAQIDERLDACEANPSRGLTACLNGR